MSFFKKGFNFFFTSVFIISLVLSGCSYLPWSNDKDEDEDLFFEEDFGSEFESEFEDVPTDKKDKGKEKEDDFFKDDNKMAQSKPAKESQSQKVPVSPDEEDFFFEDEPRAQPAPRPTPRPKPQPATKMKQKSATASGGGGFASVDQKIDKEELRVDVAVLQSQQEDLMFRVQELQKIVNNLEPRLTATQEKMDASLSTGAGSPKVNAEIQTLKLEIARLNNEISTLKKTPVLKKAPVSSKRTKLKRKVQPMRRHLKASRTPKEYNQALAAYKAGKYDESILLFQEVGLSNPPENLKDNIVFWIGSNYLKLDMHDDAIKQFQTVVTQYPGGNKVHDARYMLGVSYQKKGDTGRALDALEVALKSNPPSEVRQKIEKQLMEIK
jgi:TolA-binding protein